ncbi:MAG TPA: hypothetical protein VG984_01625 [Candidatus Paceibacterota bacterium]|nr:hypothetical protein [Candidatus Paceibacterota bacterium]
MLLVRTDIVRILAYMVGFAVGAKLSELFTTNFQWWAACIGAAVGGAVAYIAYDLREVRDGLLHAYRRTINWTPYRPYWRAVFAMCGGFLSLIYTVLTGVMILFVPEFMPLGHMAWFGLAMFVFATVFGISMGFLVVRDTKHDVGYVEHGYFRLCKLESDGVELRRTVNPVTAVRFLLSLLKIVVVEAPGLIWFFVTGTAGRMARGARAIARFAVEFIAYIHSKNRAICAMDVMFGVLVGAALSYTWLAFGVGLLVGLGFGIVHERYLAPKLLAWATARR